MLHNDASGIIRISWSEQQSESSLGYMVSLGWQESVELELMVVPFYIARKARQAT